MTLEKGFYRHFKGKLYEVWGEGRFREHNEADAYVGKAFHSEDLSLVDVYKGPSGFILEGDDSSDLEFVVYQAQYSTEDFGDMPLWVRPKEVFLGTKTVDGKEVRRFEYLGEQLNEEGL